VARAIVHTLITFALMTGPAVGALGTVVIADGIFDPVAP
jgi:hypothetical protein